MKKTIYLVSLLLILAVLLSACGSGSVENVQPVKFQYLYQGTLVAAQFLASQFHYALGAAPLPWTA
ncbi:MAG: hypothetical protein ACM3QS_09410 [Bacteroidota bacterium]